MLATVARPLSLAVLAIALTACGGDAKPAAKSPASEGTPKTADADAAKPAGDAAVADAAVTGADAAGADGAAKVKTVDGKPPGDDRYTVLVEPPTEAIAGQEAEVVVRVIPKEPWHMNLDFPTSLKLTPPPGVTLASDSLKKGDARKLDDSTCEFAVKLTPSEAGDHAVTGQFKFAVCQDEACSPVTEEVELKVAVK